MGLTIHEEPQKARLVTMGQADRVIEPPAAPIITGAELTAEGLVVEFVGSERHPEPPLEPKKQNRGRPKKMAKDKDLDKVGTKTIREDDAGEQGAIGTHGVNAPAQEKVPDSGEGEDKDNA